MAQSYQNRLATTFLIAGIALLGITAFVLKRASSPQLSPPARDALSRLDPAKVPLVTGDEPIEVLFTKAGCPVCHTIPGIPGATGQIGPALVLGTTGPQRLADPGYRGRASTVHDYIVESVLEPGTYVVSGYPDQVMPRWYGQKLSAAALEKMVGYLASLKEPQEAGTR
jgi:hypothetical protein